MRLFDRWIHNQRTGMHHRWHPNLRFWKQALVGGVIGLVLLSVAPAVAQPVDPTTLFRLNSLLSSSSKSNDRVETASVDLDGRPLLTIAVPQALGNQPMEGANALAQKRAEDIEAVLNRWLNERFDPEQLTVRSTLDKKTNLPIITINDQYLMTVTTLDAQIQGDDPDRVAQKFARTLKTALLTAQQERSPESLGRSGAIAAGIVGLVVVSSHVLSRLRRNMQEQHRALKQHVMQESNAEAAIAPASNLQADNLPRTLLQLKQQQRLNLSRVKQQLVFWGQVALWAIGIFVILGLFPYTRWLQPLVLSTPLKLAGIVLGIYILVRLSGALVDRACSLMGTDYLLPLQTSQRLALRINTISTVIKSVVSIVIIAAGGLTGLALLGVNLVPLLAGAGIVGIALSLASQNVIKDVINGFLILLEDQYAVGDVIAIGDGAIGGFVENMNLRITQLRNNEGRLITIPNGSIAIVGNLSKNWARVDLTVRVALDVDPTEIFQRLQQLSEEIYRDRAWRTKILEVPEILGIDEISHTGMLIRIWIKTQPLEQWAVAREFRRRLQQMIVQDGVEIGVPQQALWLYGLDRSAQSLDHSTTVGVMERAGS